MGCCASRPRGEQHEPQTGSAPSQDTAALSNLRPPVLRDPSRPASSNNSVASSSGAQSQVPLDQHYNAPLRHHVWQVKSSRTAWNRSKWLRKREEFFDTRVTAREEIWTSLKAVVEAMDTGDLATAQSIIDASEITLPTGNLVDGAYDKFGNLYKLPHYAVTAPRNMIEDEEQPASKEVDTSAATTYQTLDPAAAVNQEKDNEGAAPTSDEVIEVKARLSDRGGAGQDVVVSINKGDSTKALIAAVATKADLPKEKVRIAYMGKVLKPNKGLIAQGWQTGHIVNAMVTP